MTNRWGGIVTEVCQEFCVGVGGGSDMLGRGQSSGSLQRTGTNRNPRALARAEPISGLQMTH